jgi:hypothetical protein
MSNWLTSMGSSDAAEGDVISASTLNVTKFVSFFAAMFAGVTQVLTSTNIVGLSTTQMVTIWLVVAGLVVLLAITDMICRAYATAKRFGSGEASVAKVNLPYVDVKLQGQAPREAKLAGILAGGSDQLAHVQWVTTNAEGHKELGEDAWVPVGDILRVHN